MKASNVEGLPPYDVELDVGTERTFLAHRCLLAKASPYFRTMFTHNFLEERQKKVKIDGVAGEAMEIILKYIYDGNIDISMENLEVLLPAASIFAMSTLMMNISLCAESFINETTCLQIWTLASLNDYPDLVHTARQYTFANFNKIPSEEIAKLPLNILQDILQSPFLKETNREYIDGVTDCWVKTSTLKQNYMPQLLEGAKSRVERYPHQAKVLWVVGGTGSPGRALKTAECIIIRSTDGTQQWRSRIPRYCVRGQPDNNQYQVIPPMETYRTQLISATGHQRIYLLGGESLEGTTTACEEYNVDTNSWTQMPHLPEALIGASASFYNGQIFIQGNRKFYCYSPGINKQWRNLPPPPSYRRNHCLISAPGFVYLLGGYDEKDQTQGHVFQYDIAERTWKEKTPMLEGRAEFGAVRIGPAIYVMGGINNNNIIGSVERYDLVSNTWNTCEDMPGARYNMSVTVCGRQLYVIGGTNYNGQSLPYVERFNPDNGYWHTHPSLQVGRTGSAAAAFFVPEFDRPPI